MDAFDADVLIYAAVPGHSLGQRVAALLPDAEAAQRVRAGVGSVLLLPEVLAQPAREGNDGELSALASFLGRLELRPMDTRTAQVATSLAATHRLRAADAVHLATAIVAGASRFITNNRRDFTGSIDEIDVCYPDSLPEPAVQP